MLFDEGMDSDFSLIPFDESTALLEPSEPERRPNRPLRKRRQVSGTRPVPASGSREVYRIPEVIEPESVDLAPESLSFRLMKLSAFVLTALWVYRYFGG